MRELHTVPGLHDARSHDTRLHDVSRLTFRQRQSHFAFQASRYGALAPTLALRRQLERPAQYEWG